MSIEATNQNKIPEIFTHLVEFGVVVCKLCQFAIVPNQVEQHLKNHHPSQSRKSRLEAQTNVQGLDGIIQNSKDIPRPPPDQAVFKELDVHQDGLKCIHVIEGMTEECGYICRSESWMKVHCREKHGWKSCKPRGGSLKQRQASRVNDIWIKGIWNQRFFEYAQWKSFFQVKEEITSQPCKEQKQQGRAWAEMYRSEMTKRKEGQVIAGPGSRYEASPWLEMTGWAEHLAGIVKRKVLEVFQPTEREMTVEEKQMVQMMEKQRERRAARTNLMVEEQEEEDEAEERGRDERFGGLTKEEADERDEGLFQASVSTKELIREALKTCQQGKVGNSALEYIDRPEFGGRADWRLFYARQKVVTIKKYIEVWVKILRYIWRTCDVDEEERPRYRLKEEQKESFKQWQELSRQEEKGKQWKEEMKNRAGIFWLTMLDQRIHSDHHENGMISGLAGLGLNTADGSWAKPENFTPKIAAIVTTSKSLVIRQAWRDREVEIEEVMLQEGCDRKDGEWKVPGVFERVQERVQGRMTVIEFGGKPNVMDRLVRMLKFGREIRNRTKGEARVGWQGETVDIDGVKFRMTDLRMAVHGLLETASRRMRVDLMKLGSEDDGQELPKIDLGKIRDAPGVMTEGFNFVQMPDNEWEVDGYEWMAGRLGDRFGRVEKDEDGVENFVVREGVAKDWIRQLKRFKEELFVLVHMTGGAPARGTEIVSVRSENGADGRTGRGIFVDRGLVSFVTTYNKTSGMSKKLRTIHRYVPREVGELVVYYLWLIEPFERQLKVRLEGDYSVSGYIWEPEPEDEWDDEWEEEEEMDDNDDDDKNHNGREEIDKDNNHNRREEIDKDEDDGEMTASREKGINLDGFWGTDRRRRVISREMESRMGVKLTTAMWRQVYPAIQRENAGSERVKELLNEMYNQGGVMSESVSRVKIGGRGFNAREEQAGHSRWMEEMIYGLLYSESPNSTITEREEYRKVSLDWHRFLHFKSGWEDVVEGEEIKRQAEMRSEAEKFLRWKRIREMDLDQGLRDLNGPDAKFRGIQRKALKAIVAGTRRMMVIMGTGRGKSLLFMLPAKVSKGGLSIIIVPLNSLRDDMKRRCDEAGIESEEWSSKRPSFGARIVFVTPESAVTKSFARFIEMRNMAGGVDRIVIDECHMMLDCDERWRPKMLEVIMMMDKGVQVIFLTATMRPKDEVDFFDKMGLVEEEVMTLREKTTRGNVEYGVLEYDAKDEMKEIRGLVERKLVEHVVGKLIIYCDNISKGNRIADEVGGQIYNAQIGDEKLKKRVLKRMREGDERVWVATNALGVGIDIPNIRVVIHIGVKEKMRDYVQESGRAGRDSERSEGIIMRSVQKFSREVIGIGERWVEEEMREYVKGEVCRRKVIDREMDGRGDRMGCEVGELRCDVCKGQVRGGKRRRMVVNNKGDELRATQVRRIREREEERTRVLYDISSSIGRSSSVRDEEEMERTREDVELPTSDSGLGLERGYEGDFNEEGGRSFDEEDGRSFDEEDERYRVEEGLINDEIEDDDLICLVDGMDKEEGMEVGIEVGIEVGREVGMEIWRQDMGGLCREENKELLKEYRRQREGYEAEEKRRIAGRVNGRELMDDLEEKMREWSGRCMVCKAIGGERERHCVAKDWEDCRLVTGQERVGYGNALKACNMIQLDRFAGCWTCWTPRELCRRYDKDGVNKGGFRRFKEVRGGKCQWGKIVKEICAGLMIFCASKELEARWEKSTMDLRRFEEVKKKHWIEDGSKMEDVVKGLTWFGKKVEMKGIEMNEGTATILLFG